MLLLGGAAPSVAAGDSLPPSSLTVGVVQLTLEPTLEQNREKIAGFIREARERDCRVVVFPETALYAPPDAPKAEIDAAFAGLQAVINDCNLFLLLGASGTAMFAYPLVWAMHHNSFAMILTGQIGLALLLALYVGVIPVTMTELFPRRVRVTAASISYNLPFALFGGTAPMVAAWLVRQTGNPLSIADPPEIGRCQPRPPVRYLFRVDHYFGR